MNESQLKEMRWNDFHLKQETSVTITHIKNFLLERKDKNVNCKMKQKRQKKGP